MHFLRLLSLLAKCNMSVFHCLTSIQLVLCTHQRRLNINIARQLSKRKRVKSSKVVWEQHQHQHQHSISYKCQLFNYFIEHKSMCVACSINRSVFFNLNSSIYCPFFQAKLATKLKRHKKSKKCLSLSLCILC